MTEPYYIVPDIEAYRKMDPASEEARLLSRKIAANIGDYASLRLILGIDPPEFAKFYPDMDISTPSTLDTIDSFLEKYAPAPLSPIDPLQAVTPLQDLQDYKAHNALDSSESPESPDFSLSSLIKQRQYEEALKLIERQNLNNPKKSIYFAHQMRFLKKLIAIENYKTLKNKNNQGAASSAREKQ